MRVLGIIPARGGSKGIPRKNLALLAGKPLLAYTAEAALAAKRLSRVVLSTDDEEIAAVGRSLGLDVPFLRPPELARDDTPTLPVLQDVLRKLAAAGDTFDAVCILQPTNPLREPKEIDACIELLQSAAADSVFTVHRVPDKFNPHWVYFRRADGRLALSTGEKDPINRRQELPAAYHRSGSVYVVRREVLMLQNSVYGERSMGVETPADRAANIDHPADLARAERLLTERAQ